MEYEDVILSWKNVALECFIDMAKEIGMMARGLEWIQKA